MLTQNPTIIVNITRGTYSEDLAPALEPPAGWQRVNRSHLDPRFCYEHFVWLDKKGNLLYDAADCKNRSKS